MSRWVDLSALGQGLLVSVLAGAGLVAVFSLGLVGLSRYEGEVVGDGDVAVARKGDVTGLVLAVVCFAVVLVGVVVGVWSMLDK